jgi:hypothetical protein
MIESPVSFLDSVLFDAESSAFSAGNRWKEEHIVFAVLGKA